MRKRLILFLTILLIPVLSIGPLSFAQNQAEDKGKSAKQSGTMSNQEEYPDHSAEPDRYQWLFDTPEAILSAPTEELLAFFLDSDFLTIDIITRSAPLQDGSLTDYSVHPAFAELIKRPDCLIAIENMAESAIREGDSRFPYAKVYALLMQGTIRELLDQQPVIRNRIYKVLSEVVPDNEKGQYDTPSFYVPISETVLIPYYYGGTVYSANGVPCSVYNAGRELTADEKTSINAELSNFGTPVVAPSSKYNCHSYAWYRWFSWNSHWISDPAPFQSDSACTAVNASSVQLRDIVVYKNNLGVIVHSGVVYSISGSQITVKSKWGAAGVYIHSLSNVPYTYTNYGTIDVSYYRYHDYSNEYTGENYHLGTQHYYEFADRCSICGNQKNYSWVGQYCSGPPCLIPFSSVTDPDE